MKFVIKTKTHLIPAVIILELAVMLLFWNKPEIIGTDFIAWFTGMQFVVFAMLFMPEGRHGVGSSAMPNYHAAKKQWDAMDAEERKRVTKESRHDMLLWLCYTALVALSLFFALFIWIPILYPVILNFIF